jgi:4-aminobutyrate aminotransferase-like enzyme
VSIPGPRSKALAANLRRYESRNVTYFAEDFPIFWESAAGVIVTDVDGNEYIDCTAAFGVANAGHCNPRVAAAVAEQTQRLVHGMGDVHPTEIRIRLFERLARVLAPELDRFFLATTGSEAIEAALKTAILFTGKARFAAYRGGYHGLSLGALAVGGIDRFAHPFAKAIAAEPLLLEFPSEEGAHAAQRAVSDARRALEARDDIAALVIEPIQGRAGAVVPPRGYLAGLRALCDERGILLIADEIYTGFGRTGAWFATAHEGVTPDILCIGKAMGSGFPISAAVGRNQVMDAWPQSAGEALHTSTYLGSPVACAAAIATIDEIERLQLPERARRLGDDLGPRLKTLRARPNVVDVRGRGLLWGVAFDGADAARAVVARALARRVLFLQSGVRGEVVSISPPLIVGETELARAIDVLEVAVAETA